MISMWLQIQVYVDQGWRLERAAYVEDLKWTTEYVPPMDEAVEWMRNARFKWKKSNLGMQKLLHMSTTLQSIIDSKWEG